MSRVNIQRRRRELDRYIDSLGEELPIDFHEFISGALMQNRCIFCEDEHQGYMVYKMEPVNSTAKDMGIHACLDCAQHVEALLQREYDINTRQLDDITGPSEDEEKIALRDRLMKIENLTFDPDVYMFLVHHKPNADRFITDTCNRCYICRAIHPSHRLDFAYTDDDWQTIEVPVTLDGTLASGKVWVCDQCQDDIGNVNEIYEDHVWSGNLFPCTCDSCKDKYYINKEEWAYRETFTQYKPAWLCTECAYLYLDNLEDNHWLFLEDNRSPRHDVMHRFITQPCSACARSFYLDLMITSDHLRIRNFVRENFVICEACASEGVKSFLLHEYTFNFQNNIYIRMMREQEETQWDFSTIILRPGKSGLDQVFAGRTEESDPVEAVLVAMEETRLLFHGSQKELWDGD